MNSDTTLGFIFIAMGLWVPLMARIYKKKAGFVWDPKNRKWHPPAPVQPNPLVEDDKRKTSLEWQQARRALRLETEAGLWKDPDDPLYNTLARSLETSDSEPDSWDNLAAKALDRRTFGAMLIDTPVTARSIVDLEQAIAGFRGGASWVAPNTDASQVTPPKPPPRPPGALERRHVAERMARDLGVVIPVGKPLMVIDTTDALYAPGEDKRLRKLPACFRADGWWEPVNGTGPEAYARVMDHWWMSRNKRPPEPPAADPLGLTTQEW